MKFSEGSIAMTQMDIERQTREEGDRLKAESDIRLRASVLALTQRVNEIEDALAKLLAEYRGHVHPIKGGS